MNPTTRRAALIGVTALSTALCLAAPASAPASAAASPRSGARPAVSANPPHLVTGRATGKAAADGVIFSCQSPTAPVTCYGPQQIRHAYGIDSLISAGYSGSGKTIVVVDAYQSPTIRRDLSIFNQVFGLAGTELQIVAPDGLTPFQPGDANMVGWSQEISLDVEWAHAIAPGAKIVLALAKSSNDNDLQSVLSYVVDHRLGDVVTQSFGEAEKCYGVNADGTRQPGTTLAAQHAIFAKAASKGMTVFASAGDSGSTEATCDGLGTIISASTPASDPLVTGVGGTQLFANPINGNYQREVVWNEEKTFGPRAVGGGGFSSVYAVPSFQKSLGSLPSRGVPDVAYNAAINGGVLVAYSATQPPGTFFLFGGTSSGSPQWAGIAADVAQLNHGSLGDINPALYQIARRTPSAFRDVTKGQNGSGGLGGFTAGVGWDAASGLGSPQAGALGLALAAAR
ncbi:MAG: S53 family peptidase [Lapillicoccus sp.]